MTTPTTDDHPEPTYGGAYLTVHRHAGKDRVIGDDDYWRISLDAPDPFMDRHLLDGTAEQA